MAVNWLGVFKHLLPDARAWQMTIDKQLRQFFFALGQSPLDDARAQFDDVYDDLDPQKTNQLDYWEAQWNLSNAGLTEQQRRDRLEGQWSALGGQDQKYIQNTLRNAGFDVYVHEAWEPSVDHPSGGSVDGDVTATYRNPLDFLTNSQTEIGFIGLGHDDAYLDSDVFFLAAAVTVSGYALVNKINDPAYTQPAISADPATFPYYLYISGVTFPAPGVVATARQAEFERLCLRVCPAHIWLGIIVSYQ